MFASLTFSDTSTKLGIIQACEDTCALGDAGISGQATTLKVFTRYVNKTMSDIWTTIFFSYGGWQYDDSNQTTLPTATDTLTASQVSYALPTGTHGIRSIQIKDTGGVWHELSPLTQEQILQRQADTEFLKTASMPVYYVPVGDSIRIYPPSNFTQAASFKVSFDREMTAFASSDTTRVPGIPTAFHDAIPCGASLEWYRVNRAGSEQYQELKSEWEGNPTRQGTRNGGWLNKIGKFYRQRYEQLYPPRFTTMDTTKQYV